MVGYFCILITFLSLLFYKRMYQARGLEQVVEEEECPLHEGYQHINHLVVSSFMAFQLPGGPQPGGTDFRLG